MKNLRPVTLFLFLLLCVQPHQAHADTYFVRTTGSDSNSGTSPGEAFASLDHAADQLGPGDTVYIGSGTYTERVQFTTSGLDSQPIRIIGDLDGSRTGDAGEVVLNFSTNSQIVRLANANYYEFINLKFDMGQEAIRIDSSVGILIDRCEFEGSRISAINIVNNGSVQIQNSTIRGERRGVYVTNGSATILDTTLENLGTEALQIQNSGSSITAKRCVIRDVRRALYTLNGNAELINCLIYKTTHDGVWTRNQSTLIMVHNTLDQIGRIGARFRGNSTLYNNIFSNINSHCMRLDGGRVTASHNLVYQRRGDRSNRFNSLEYEFDPMYIDSANGDYTLHADSGARDIGFDTSSYTTQDIAMNARPDNGGWDLGVYEGQSIPTYYVRTRGSDSNDGLSAGSSFRTIQKAVSMSTKAGTTIYVGPGAYSETVEFGTGSGSNAASGTEDRPTQLIADRTGEFTFDSPGQVIIDGRNSSANGFSLSSIDHWVIDGFTFENQRTYGIYGSSIGAQIINCIFDVPAGYAIYATATGDIKVADCTFNRNSDSAHAMWITPSNTTDPTSVLITRNDISMKNDAYLSTGYQTGSSAIWSRPRNNRYTYGIIIYGFGSPLIARVEISNNQLSDFYLPIYASVNSSSAPSTIIANNTVTGSLYSIYSYAYSTQSVALINNIIDTSYFGMLSYTRSNASQTVSGHLENNLTMDMARYRRSFEDLVINGSPMFTDAAAGDFSLIEGSPAIDAGTSTDAPTVDIAGRARPVDGDEDEIAQIDLGAYELVTERQKLKMVKWREISGHRDMSSE